ncbi:17699_t:CDS:2, partial [Dentiscutata erythropus]
MPIHHNLVPSSNITERVQRRINEVNTITNINEARCIIQLWSKDDVPFSLDFKESMLNFIRSVSEK